MCPVETRFCFFSLSLSCLSLSFMTHDLNSSAFLFLVWAGGLNCAADSAGKTITCLSLIPTTCQYGFLVRSGRNQQSQAKGESRSIEAFVGKTVEIIRK